MDGPAQLARLSREHERSPKDPMSRIRMPWRWLHPSRMTRPPNRHRCTARIFTILRQPVYSA
jgi:hypothetical protein